MNENEAINILTQAVLIGQKHGIYSLRDSSLIFQALNILNPDFEKNNSENVPVTPDEEPEKK